MHYVVEAKGLSSHCMALGWLKKPALKINEQHTAHRLCTLNAKIMM